MEEAGSHSAVRWVIAIVVVLGVIALLAWRRNGPGVGDRFPDESIRRVTLVVPTHDSTVVVAR